jgi:hypothetical protein
VLSRIAADARKAGAMTLNSTAKLTAAALILALAACAPGAPKGIDKEKLDDAVGTAIGDPGTCVVIVEKASGKTVWRYGSRIVCSRELPSCQGNATRTLDDLAAAAARGSEETQSCNSVPDGSRGVGWVSGPAGDPSRGLAYAVVMESDRALPGREIKLRLESALKKAGM